MSDRCWVRFAPRTCPGRPWGQRAPVDHRCERVDVVPLAPHRVHLCHCGAWGTDADLSVDDPAARAGANRKTRTATP